MPPPPPPNPPLHSGKPGYARQGRRQKAKAAAGAAQPTPRPAQTPKPIKNKAPLPQPQTLPPLKNAAPNFTGRPLKKSEHPTTTRPASALRSNPARMPKNGLGKQPLQPSPLPPPCPHQPCCCTAGKQRCAQQGEGGGQGDSTHTAPHTLPKHRSQSKATHLCPCPKRLDTEKHDPNIHRLWPLKRANTSQKRAPRQRAAPTPRASQKKRPGKAPLPSLPLCCKRAAMRTAKGRGQERR